MVKSNKEPNEGVNEMGNGNNGISLMKLLVLGGLIALLVVVIALCTDRENEFRAKLREKMTPVERCIEDNCGHLGTTNIMLQCMDKCKEVLGEEK